MKLTILRGLPGSGKSTLAAKQGGLVLTSDDFFIVSDKYTWDSAMLGPAHRWNQWRCRIAMERGTPHIVIDNTNTYLHEAKPYVLLATKHNYRVVIVETNTPWSRDPELLTERCQHDIPREKIEEMLERWEEYTVKKILQSTAPWEKPALRPSMLKCLVGAHDWTRWGYPRVVSVYGVRASYQHRRCFRCGKESKRKV